MQTYFDRITTLKQSAMIPGTSSVLRDNVTPSHTELMTSTCPILTAINLVFPPTIHKFSVLARVAVLDSFTLESHLTPYTKLKLNAFLFQGSQLQFEFPQQPLHELLAELDQIATRALLRALRQDKPLPPPSPVASPEFDPFNFLQDVEPLSPSAQPATPKCQQSPRRMCSPIGEKLPPPPTLHARLLNECGRLDVCNPHGVKELVNVFGAPEL